MRVIVAVVLGFAALAFAAPRGLAQAGDPPALCSSSSTLWNAVGSGHDLAAMRRVRTQTPAVCRQLLARIDARIAVLTAPRPTASAPADPCVQARADWETVQFSSDSATIGNYLRSIPAACRLQKEQASARLAGLDAAVRQTQLRQRLQQELAGNWFDSNCDGANTRIPWTFSLTQAEMVMKLGVGNQTITYHFTDIADVEGALVVSVDSVDFGGGARTTIARTLVIANGQFRVRSEAVAQEVRC
jgi:hypothetical protein